jgi:hypothetical protein
MKRLIVLCVFGAALAMPSASLAAGNPMGTGQPSQSCGSDTAPLAPPGFSSGGFANAEFHYAGSEGNPNASGNTHAVSQYDVACYHFSQSHTSP